MQRGRRSAGRQLEHPGTTPAYSQRGGAFGGGLLNSTYQLTEEDMWKEFSKHFKNQQRRTTPANHHDFLDVYKHARESGDFSSHPHSRANRDADREEYMLGVDRIARAHRNYNKLKL